MQTIGSGAFQEGIGELLESDADGAQAVGQPMVLVETDTGGERKSTNIRPQFRSLM